MYHFTNDCFEIKTDVRLVHYMNQLTKAAEACNKSVYFG